jgi:Ca-activated chloride channel family protein
MTDSMARLNRDTGYCFNPQCQQPQNDRSRDNCEACGTTLLLHKRYRGIALLGTGGFGRTFKAIDESQVFASYCAVKQFCPQDGNREKASALFEQEAAKLQALGKHSQIPLLLDYFVENDCQYLVQEFIDGRNLAQELGVESFDEGKIKALLLDLLPVLQKIHAERVIHRDIKPENIIRDHNNNLFLVDFGAAKYATETTLGKTGTSIGSAAYTAPEQVRGKAVFASDLYSLGVTCVHLLTNIQPFDLYDNAEDKWIWRQYLAKNPKISPALGKILDRMLESGTKKRYATAKDVLQDLQRGTSTIPSQVKWLLAVSLLLWGWVSLFNALTPVRQQVSNPSPSVLTPVTPNPQPVPTPSTNGGLFADIEGRQQALTLKNTNVKAKVAGNLSRVEVTQSFANPYNKPLEAVYKFPLPDDAAVDDMEIIIGDRVIRGSIEKKEEAQKIYNQAKEAGQTAGLLEQERDNVFVQSLANILPGEQIDVTIRYSNSLKFEGGEYEFVFPMVVAPRYEGKQENSSTAQTKINPPILLQNRSGQDISVDVEIEAGVPISLVESPTHQIKVQESTSEVNIKLQNAAEIPNKDLILRYQVAGADTQTTVLTQADKQGGHFATYLIPAVEYSPKQIVPKDVVFLIDTSGSQSGEPIAQSKELMRQFIGGLNPDDTFTIIDFSSTATKLSNKPLANTAANRDRALAYVNNLEANGGTELMNGINTVLDFPAAPADKLRSIVLLTDGLIGDDKYIIGEVQKRLQPGNRLYTFGVGSSTNRFLIDRLAEVGRGTAEVVPLNDSAVTIAQEFFQEINNPVLTNVEVTWIGSGEKPEIYPLSASDLFANQPLVLYGRKGDKQNGKLQINGSTAGGKHYRQILDVNFNQISGNSAIAQLWGRAKIKDLNNQMYWGSTPQGVEAITNTALAYHLLSDYTSFVAVDEEIRTNPQQGSIKEDVAVELAEGMDPNLDLSQPQQPSASNSNSSSSDVPEPGQIWGNLLALLLLIFFFNRKRIKKVKDEL